MSAERCEQEIERCRNLSGDTSLSLMDRVGAQLGELDWMVAKRLEEEAYETFLARKTQQGAMSGFEPKWMPDFLFDFQHALTDWMVRKGRAAIFADCGLGKTPMQQVWAENVVRETNRPVLILTPLGVSSQTLREAEKFGIQCRRSSDGKLLHGDSIVVTNYERLHYFDPHQFAGVVCDESSILKSFDGERRSQITEFMRKMPYRLLCTATSAPNDYTELGTHSEALGELGHLDMLNRFFKNAQNTIQPMRRHIVGQNFRNPVPLVEKWRFKGHAEVPFWRWVCSWARACRKPSDLGFEDRDFILPPLIETEHLVTAERLADGALFAVPAIGLKEQREERRRTLKERCERVAELVSSTGQPALIWCHLNSEGDLLEKIIPDGLQVSGKHTDEVKEERLLAFANGQLRVLITKPKIGAWGLNFQNCAHVVEFPSHSYEAHYQGVRRCWRFGQKRSVQNDIVTTEGERVVLENQKRKAAAAEKMFGHLIHEMSRALGVERDIVRDARVEIPEWLQ